MLSRSVTPDSLWPHGLLPVRLLCPWEFSRQEYWCGLPCPPPKDLPNPGIEPRSPALQADSLPSEPIILQIKEKKKLKTYIPGKKLWFHSFNQPAFIMQLLYTWHCQGNMRDSKEVPQKFWFLIHWSAHSFRDSAEYLLSPGTVLDAERQQTDKSPT